MRLHTDKIEASQVYEATRGLPGVYAEVTEHGSRSRQRGPEVRLEGNGYRRNSGQYGADPVEVGADLATIFEEMYEGEGMGGFFDLADTLSEEEFKAYQAYALRRARGQEGED